MKSGINGNMQQRSGRKRRRRKCFRGAEKDQVNEENEVVTKHGKTVHRRHGDDESEQVVCGEFGMVW